MDASDLKATVREKYGQAALRAGSGGSSCCGSSSASGSDPITSNLYDDAESARLPAEALLASLGCGNPTALAQLNQGETVLDLGSGGGIDVLLSAKRVGAAGKVYGLDMTDEMLALANENKRKAGATNVEFLKGEIERIPLPADTVDVIISNCVINLSRRQAAGVARGVSGAQARRAAGGQRRSGAGDAPAGRQAQYGALGWVRCRRARRRRVPLVAHRRRVRGCQHRDDPDVRNRGRTSVPGEFRAGRRSGGRRTLGPRRCRIRPGAQTRSRFVEGFFVVGLMLRVGVLRVTSHSSDSSAVREAGTGGATMRCAQPNDLSAVERLLSQASLPLDGVAQALPSFIVAESEGELVGVAGLEVCCDNALLRSVAIAPEWRGRGLGRALVGRVIADAEARGIRALYLLTTTAEHYFPSFGFAPTARDHVPADVRETQEFRSACPASATVMSLELTGRGDATNQS